LKSNAGEGFGTPPVLFFVHLRLRNYLLQDDYMDLLKPKKKREPLEEKMTLPLTKSQFERYRDLANKLHDRKLAKLHDLTRERIEILLNEVELELKKSS